MCFNKKAFFCYIAAVSLFIIPQNLFAMHIMEGFLPGNWCVFWFIVAAPFVAAGLITINKQIKLDPKIKLLLGVAGAFTFILSALKIPSVTGSCSHPTGTGLGAILFGPFPMAVLGVIVLLFQALLLAHGGLTTLGANTFSMAIAGPILCFLVYKGMRRIKISRSVAVFSGAFLGDLFTYVVTSFQLASAFPAPEGGLLVSFVKFLGIFAITQIPLAIIEGLLTVLLFNFIAAYNKTELRTLSVISEEE